METGLDTFAQDCCLALQPKRKGYSLHLLCPSFIRFKSAACLCQSQARDWRSHATFFHEVCRRSLCPIICSDCIGVWQKGSWRIVNPVQVRWVSIIYVKGFLQFDVEYLRVVSEILSKKLKDKDWRESEKQLLNNANNNWKVNFADSGKLPTIPVRDSNGVVYPFQLSKNWEGWLDVLPDLAFCDIQARHKGKPVRHLNIPLSSVILIKPRSEHETMLTARFKSKEQFFQDLINTINKNNSDPDSSQVGTSTRPYPWSLELYSDTKAKGYIKVWIPRSRRLNMPNS